MTPTTLDRPMDPAVAPAPGNEMLRITDLHAFYGESHVLHGIDLRVAEGELITLLGRNGSGRSTTLKSVMGLVGRRSGSVMFNGRELVGVSPHAVARLGVGFCPEERGIFAGLSTEENLLLPPVVRSGGMTLDEIYQVFPNLYERRTSPGTRLSGGEQQMLAIGAYSAHGGEPDSPRRDRRKASRPVIVQQIGRTIGDPPAQEPRLHDPSGRAEFPLRRYRGGSSLRGRTWPL